MGFAACPCATSPRNGNHIDGSKLLNVLKGAPRAEHAYQAHAQPQDLSCNQVCYLAVRCKHLPAHGP